MSMWVALNVQAAPHEQGTKGSRHGQKPWVASHIAMSKEIASSKEVGACTQRGGRRTPWILI